MTATSHIVVNRARTKRPPRRCTTAACAQLTRHQSQRCPEHRSRA